MQENIELGKRLWVHPIARIANIQVFDQKIPQQFRN